MEAYCMKNRLFTFCLFTIFIFFACVFSLSGHPLAKAANTIGIKIMDKEVLGKYLADAMGITLYSYGKDEKNISHCIEGCAVNWPPFYLEPSAVVDGLKPADFTTISRPDGLRQTTYKGMPLYYFRNDKYPGDTFGHGIGDAWFIVVPQ
jgi:predicted lipoprotein with Yx(FWY)xxD motif